MLGQIQSIGLDGPTQYSNRQNVFKTVLGANQGRGHSFVLERVDNSGAYRIPFGDRPSCPICFSPIREIPP